MKVTRGAADSVELAPGLRGLPSFTAVQRLDDPVAEVTLEVAWRDGAYRLEEVSVRGEDLGRDVLDRVPLRALLARAIFESLDVDPTEDAASTARAALAYRVGLLMGEAPVSLVQAFLGVSPATASRRVAQAREAGLLRDDERAPRGGASARASQVLEAYPDLAVDWSARLRRAVLPSSTTEER